MYITIKFPLQRTVIVTDDKLIHGKKEYPISSIKKVEITKDSSLKYWYGDGPTDFWGFVYDKNDKSHVEAVDYIMSCVYTEEERKEAEEQKQREAAKQKEIEEKGFRKRCSICGKIFCYTLQDLEENKKHTQNILLSSVTSIAGVFSGNYVVSATSSQTAGDEKSRIIDYNKCPSCGSRSLVDLTDEDIAQINAQQNNQSITSTADELKKLKELLDIGIITQEEFDTKKKQLLGL